ncbi:branched-chain amino acid aminotransferase [Candidatus Bathyarchaeota archaeon]|nr:MAG: branched-chain amino acid aminotransferase [Candidatus Wolframiiraptor sp.]RLG08615.1 MAG: branched-chain amino acid aminotransferase [Nitrososphaerota archaeon]RLI45515.1 MAG: branched-chain amino acid aminotransferase [Candidatus Bathyarchaeota archaeon]HDD39648.1 branched-chain-amino-acid transaminase [Nitrososphaeria archaeon]
MEKEEPLIYINGKFYPKSEASVSVYDHGFLYGDGVFEGIRAYNGVVFKLREHIERLYASAKAIMLEIPMDKEEMVNAVLETLRRNKLKDAYIRLLVTRGVGDLGLDPRKCKKPNVIIIAEPMLPLYGKESKLRGISLIFSSVRRDRVDATTHQIKSMNYLNSILAKLEAIDAGADDAIMLDERGFVAETTATNIFIIRNGKIITPPTTTGALPGITRNFVIELAGKLGYSVEEREITPFEVITADEVFITGTGAEIVPVTKIAGRVIGRGTAGEITMRLIEEFEREKSNAANGIKIYE